MDTAIMTLMEQIDEIKQLLPDQKYIDIMDSLTKVNESKSLILNDNILTELWYKLQQHNAKILYTEGSDYIRDSSARLVAGNSYLIHPAEIHMVLKGEGIESFVNADNGHYDKQTITIDIDFTVDIKLLQINTDTVDQLTVIISTNRPIYEISKVWNISRHIIQYIHYLSMHTPSSNS